MGGCQCAKAVNQEEQNEITSKAKDNNSQRHNNDGKNHTQTNEIVNSKTGDLEQSQKDVNQDNNKLTQNKGNINDNPNYNQVLTDNKIDDDLPNEPFTIELLDLLNKIRGNPRAFADIIEERTSHIEVEKGKLIYNNGVKVRLTRGREAFMETCSILRQLHGMDPLKFKNNMCVQSPSTREAMDDKKYLIDQIELLQEKTNIDSFWNYQVGVPETAIILMLVSDTKSSSGKKRNDLLNPDFKYIGISSAQFGKYFNSYLTFSQ